MFRTTAMDQAGFATNPLFSSSFQYLSGGKVILQFGCGLMLGLMGLWLVCLDRGERLTARKLVQDVRRVRMLELGDLV